MSDANLQANDFPNKRLSKIPAISDGNTFLQNVFETSEDFAQPIIKTITPEIARKLLERNSKNRPIRRLFVKWLANQMTTGRWRFTADSVKFSVDGLLCDKQHTLSAIIEAGTPQPLIIICGLEDQVFDVLDTGMSRTASDVLSVKGIPNANRVAAVCKSVLLFKANRKGHVLGTGGSKEVLSDDSIISNARILQEVTANPLYLIAAREGGKYYGEFRGLSHSQYGTFYFLFSEKDQSDAEEFLTKLAYGVGLSETSPIYLLRKRLEQAKMGNIKYTSHVQLYWIIMC